MSVTNERLHGLDAVRAIALLLGIWLHASMSFFVPIPALDVSPSRALETSAFVIHLFRMSAFYFIAGFFGRLLVERRGVGAFAKDRLKRIGIPLLAGWFILVPISIAIIVWGVSRSFPDGVPAAFQPPEPRLPLLHLWFLYYLGMFYVGILCLRLTARRLPGIGVVHAFGDAIVAGSIRSHAAPLLLALPVALVLYFDPAWVLSGGIPTPDQGLAAQAPALVGYGAAFGFGWLVQRHSALLNVWRACWVRYLGLAIVLTVAALAILGPRPAYVDLTDAAQLTQLTGPAWLRIAYAGCYTLAIWCWTFALIGAGLALCSRPSIRWRYLADASYWIYLAHMPVIMLLQVVVSDWPIHWAIKFPLIVFVGVGLLLLAYRHWVRGTWLGALLNGRRYPPLSAGRKLEPVAAVQSGPDPGSAGA